MKQVLLVVLLLCLIAPARAQVPGFGAVSNAPQVSEHQPVTFSADEVRFDQEHNLVIASGHVEAWQNDHILRADLITFDRNTGVAAAQGNVTLLEPDGEVMFADYAELTQDMNTGILKDMRALLAQNGKLAANGARRTAGKINELAKVVYSACDLCKDNPKRAPLWQIRASSGLQDIEHKKIEYRDATVQFYGIPVAYFPFLTVPDPSVKRASGILAPAMGSSSHLGGFFALPYYGVLDDQSDVTITPMMTTHAGPQLSLEYRRRFNSGFFDFNGSTGRLNGAQEGTISTQGQFALDENWRVGFDFNRASSASYLRNLRVDPVFSQQLNVLSSQAYLEGFGAGAYSRLDTHIYQGVSNTITDSKLPVALPRYLYSYMGRPDAWGGRLSVDAGGFNVMRKDGVDTRRVNLTANYERPFAGRLGDLWTVTLHADAVAYSASHLNEQPVFSPYDRSNRARALPQVAVDFRWPFMRDSGDWGVQVIEPMLQVVAAPRTGDRQNILFPNEDSLDLEFSDANLFGFNRFPGLDRLEGGTRLNAAMHGTWYVHDTTFDGLIGQSYRTYTDNLFPAYSGLHDPVSDIVGRLKFTPTSWFDLTYRTRLDHHSLKLRTADVTSSFGVPKFRMSVGYLYTQFNPLPLFDTAPPPPSSSLFYSPRNEITLSASSNWERVRFSGFVRHDITRNRLVAFGGDAVYEDECFILDLRVFRRNTSINNDFGATAVLLQFTLKTVGQFGYRAL